MGTLKTNEVNPNILDFLEEKKVNPETFRSLWQASEWENKLVMRKSKTTVEGFVRGVCSQFKMSEVKELTTQTDRFRIYCLYSRFVLGKDLLCNLSVEVQDDGVVAHLKMRSQNMGVVVMVGKKMKRLTE